MKEDSDVIWPLSVRFIHWGIALIVLLDAFWFEEGDAPHRYLGYLGVGLVLIRAAYGFMGKGHVLFSSMPLRLHDLKFYIKNHFRGSGHFEGHNPLASGVYILMWLLILGLGITGWMLELDAFWGSETLENVHSQMSNVLIALVVIHLLGLFLDAVLYKRRTWMGMIDGKRK
jgi:cytochrome b